MSISVVLKVTDIWTEIAGDSPALTLFKIYYNSSLLFLFISLKIYSRANLANSFFAFTPFIFGSKSYVQLVFVCVLNTFYTHCLDKIRKESPFCHLIELNHKVLGENFI